MKIALVNPRWDYEGSTYFGCRAPHLPLEYGYAKALLEDEGHRAAIIDGTLEDLDEAALAARIADFAPELTVVTTAPSYLFWRCPPPELRVPERTLRALRDLGGHKIIVGPHASTTPATTLAKLEADVAVLGECEEVLQRLASTAPERWDRLPGVALRGGDGTVRINGGPHKSDLAHLPPLRWRQSLLVRHDHHHHRFGDGVRGLGAEIEWSRGCPCRCTFCANETHRDRHRKRPLDHVLDELDGLIAAGVTYVYFIDEIFVPDAALLEALSARPVAFGMQTRIDLWSLAELDQLGAAGCVTIDAGVESVAEDGRDRLAKRRRLDNDALAARLIRAKRRVPFVQATLMSGDAIGSDPAALAQFRERLLASGVWVNDPAPLFPYPGSPDYRRLWGEPDEDAWERAHVHYLAGSDDFSDVSDVSNIQGGRPERRLRQPELETGH